MPFSSLQDFNQFVAPGRGKARQISIKIRLDLPDTYRHDAKHHHQVEWTKIWRESGEMADMSQRNFVGGEKFGSYSKIPKLLDRIRFTYVPAVKDRAFFADMQGRLYDVLASVAAEPLRDSAEVFENQLQAQLEALLTSIQEVFSGDAAMRLPENLRTIFENLEIRSGEVPLSRRGDGIKIRHIPMLLKFIAEKQDEIMNKGGIRFTHIWGFEEPENNVEMAACFKMADDLCNLIEVRPHYQLFMTTHSPIFYRLNNRDGEPDEKITTHFVEKIGNDSKVTSRDPEQVDETMGLMPLLAPFVLEAKERYEEAVAESDRMKELAARRCPTLFVEGITDKMVLQKALATLAPGAVPNLLIQDGGDDYGSANAVASRALAWQLEMRHRAPRNIVPAMAIFDKDPAGISARHKLSEDMKHVGMQGSGKFLIYEIPPFGRFIPLMKNMKIPIDLESCYPDEVWEHAEDQGWLEDADPYSYISDDLAKAILRGERQDPITALREQDRWGINRRFTDDGKIKVARYIRDLPTQDAARILQHFTVIVRKIVTQLTWAPGQMDLDVG